jgi:glycosyltransferase involved in cell wall biosynthesis
MKNILVLNYEFPPLWGWASPVSYEISKWYVDLWYNVDVITMWYKDLPEYEQVEGINIYRVKCLRTKKQVCHPWEQATYLYSGYKKAKELLKTKNYDICHCHFIIPTWVIAMKLKKEFDLDYIVTAHGSDVLWHNPRFTLLYKILQNPWKKVIKNAKSVISPSKFLKERIENYYWPSNKIQVIPNWIQKDKFKPLEKERYILTVSRLQKWKWIQDLLTAIKDIDLWEYKVKIVWEWPYKETLEKIVIDYWLESKVEFLGWVDNKSDEMKELYGKASIFCQPSFFESFWLTLLEAMQAGCVLLWRDIWWFAWVRENTSNILFEDVKDLQEKISNLINDEKWLKSISNDNIEKIKNFEWDEIVKEYKKRLIS